MFRVASGNSPNSLFIAFVSGHFCSLDRSRQLNDAPFCRLSLANELSRTDREVLSHEQVFLEQCSSAFFEVFLKYRTCARILPSMTNEFLLRFEVLSFFSRPQDVCDPLLTLTSVS